MIGLGGIIGIAPQRIVVADTVRVMADVVARRLIAPGLGGHAEGDAEAFAQIVDAFLGDFLKSGFDGIKHMIFLYLASDFVMACSRSRSTLRLTLPAGVFGSWVT